MPVAPAGDSRRSGIVKLVADRAAVSSILVKFAIRTIYVASPLPDTQADSSELFMAIDIKTIGIRALSGAVYVALIVACVLSGMYTVSLMAVLFAVLASVEFSRITRGLSRDTLPLVVADAAGCALLALTPYVMPLAGWMFYLVSRLVMELYCRNEDPLRSLGSSFMSQIYIGVPFAVMVLMAVAGMECLLLAVFLMIWINDTGAFLVGITCGRHRLFERISPKKSWEGFWGGLALTVVASLTFCFTCSGFFGLPSVWWIWLILGVAVSVFGTWGDLIESLIKRDLRIKDSGTLMPGHGGILDRLDSLLLVLPALMLLWMILALMDIALISQF